MIFKMPTILPETEAERIGSGDFDSSEVQVASPYDRMGDNCELPA